jgi:hypothetical protein
MRTLTLILVAALSMALAPAPTAGFDEALARAKRYEKQFNDFRMDRFYAVVGQAMANLGQACIGDEPIKAERDFIIVVSYRDGRFDKVETDNADPAAACYQAALAKLDYPAPPVADFAEELEMHLMPDDAPIPGRAPPADAGKPDRH